MLARLAVALAVVLCACVTAPVAPVPPEGHVSVAVFERDLAPYGEWLIVAPYGRVWRPAGIGSEWRPYLYGEWLWTDEGWFWSSDEPWGWATYHYGRWAFGPAFGWIWVPGTAWAPAWVAWRVADGYVGWAPLVPGVDAWWADTYLPDPTYWVFVRSPSFVGVRVNTVALPAPQAAGLVARSRPAPPPGHGVPAPPRGGPTRPDVERHVGRPIPPVRIVPVQTPDEARQRPVPTTVPTYRPAPPKNRPAPAPARERDAR